jgi:hypothetical protein
MHRVLVSVFIFATAAFASDANREVAYQTDSLRPLNMPPTFAGGYLAVHDRGGIAVYSRDGTLRYRIPYEYPPGGSIRNVAVDTDGTAAATVDFWNKGGISLWNTEGTKIRDIDTGEYVPSFVAFAPDHSVWTTGTRTRARPENKTDYLVLRHFSREGALRGAYLPRSSFASDREPAESITALPGIHIANGRVGMYLPGGGNRQRVWVETDLNGKELGRWLMNSGGHPAAMTHSGAVYARGVSGLLILDRAAGQWSPVSLPSDGILIGAEGESLVFADRTGSCVRWVALSTQ